MQLKLSYVKSVVIIRQARVYIRKVGESLTWLWKCRILKYSFQTSYSNASSWIHISCVLCYVTFSTLKVEVSLWILKFNSIFYFDKHQKMIKYSIPIIWLQFQYAYLYNQSRLKGFRFSCVDSMHVFSNGWCQYVSLFVIRVFMWEMSLVVGYCHIFNS